MSAWKTPASRIAIIGMAVLGLLSLVAAWGSLESLPGTHAMASRDWESRLSAGGAIRARALDLYLEDELGDLRLIAEYPTIRAALGHDAGATTHARTILASTAASLQLGNVCLLNAAGAPVLFVGGDPTCGLTAAPVIGHPVIVSGGDHQPPRIVLAAPVSSAAGVPIGFVVELVDPAQQIYPLLMRDSTRSSSVTGYLVAGGSEGIVWLAPNLPATRASRAPAAGTLAAAMAGGTSLAFGRYRDFDGTPVLASSIPLGRAPWTLVVTVDEAHALEPYRREVVRSGLFVLLFVATVGLALFGWWRSQLARSASELAGSRERATIERRRAESEIRNLNRLLRMLSAVNELIAKDEDRQQLFDGVVRITCEEGNFVAAWIGLAEPGGEIAITAVGGQTAEGLRQLRPRWDDSPAGSGVAGRSIREQRSTRINDPAGFPAPFQPYAAAHGIQSVAGSPIRLGDRVIGVLVIHDRTPGVFTDDVMTIVDRVAGNIGHALVALDASQRSRQLEEQFRQAQKMEAVGRLAGGVAHDFNNLLTVMFAETGRAMETIGPKDDELRGSLRFIEEAARQAAALTRQLLAFSRRQVLRPQTISLGDLVKTSGAMLRRVLGEDVAISIEIADEPLPVRVDPGQMDQVIMNLAVNARDAMPNGGTLTLAVAPVTVDRALAQRYPECEPGSYIMLTVRDTGSGMSPDILSQIFEPFFTTKELGRGTGLGLSTVYGIVRQSRGIIAVESTPGEGTTFRVYLPRVAAPAARDTAAPATPSRGTETILLTEDDKAVRKVVASSLARCGFTVLEAGTADEAMALGASHGSPIHLLLTDVVMPNGRGDDLARRFRATCADVPVLFMSGYTDTAKIFGEHQLPRTDFLHKPFTITELTGRIRHLLDGDGESDGNHNGNGGKD